MRAILILIPILLLLPAVAMSAPGAEIGGNLSAGGISGNITHVCGDGVILGSEECDGSNLNGKTCQSLGYVSGALACKADCTFDKSACISSPGGGGGSSSFGGGGLSCPTCPNATSWSTCTSSKQTRTAYRCNATTNYTCQSYTESQSCTVPAKPTTNITETDASTAISSAESAIADAKAQDRNTTTAEAKLAEARTAFTSKNWTNAKSLADSAAQMARTAPVIPSPTPSALPIEWILAGLAIVVAASLGTTFMMFRYEHVPDATTITRRHAGKRVLLHSPLDPIKSYPNGDVVFRMQKGLVGIGNRISPRPSTRYRVWGKVHTTDGQPYVRIHRLEPLA